MVVEAEVAGVVGEIINYAQTGFWMMMMMRARW